MNKPGYNKITVDGLEFAYYHEGKGEIILMLHGITTNSFIWRNIIPYLTDSYEVIVPDLLGCGQSSKRLDADYSIKNQAELMVKLIKKLKLPKVHLVCHDIGGGIGQIIAVRHPEILIDLSLINSVAYDYWPVQPINTLRTPIIRQIAMATIDMGMLRLSIRAGLHYKDRLTPELFALFEEQMENKASRKAFLHLAKSLNNKDLLEISDKLTQLSLPVLIIRGEADVFLNKGIAFKLHKNIPGSQLQLIETAGHFAQIDEPEKISNFILQFFEKYQ